LWSRIEATRINTCGVTPSNEVQFVMARIMLTLWRVSASVVARNSLVDSYLHPAILGSAHQAHFSFRSGGKHTPY
jgi:hypothetical protein